MKDSPSHPPARNKPRASVWAGLMMCLAACWLSACGGSGSDVVDSDANGYQCRACKAKFFTERELFAVRCPACKSVDLARVVGFVCDKDGHTTLSQHGAGSASCERCQATLASIRLPRGKELRAWGAEEKNKKDVL